MRSLGAGLAVALVVLLSGCNENPVGAPSSEEFAAQRDKLKAALSKRKSGGPSQGAPPAADQLDLDAGFTSVGETYVYDGTGKRDPFRSFRFVDEGAPNPGFGPLGDFELSQLSVVAVVWQANKPRGLVSDPGGRSFVVHEGSQIGKNNGRVIHIGDNLVLVKETFVDFEGKETTKDVEMRIRRSQGG